jgi:hypothetical protein
MLAFFSYSDFKVCITTLQILGILYCRMLLLMPGFFHK